MQCEGDGAGPTERVHVRRLDVADTLRWSWYALLDHRELVALTFAAQLLSVGATAGISQESPTDVPEAAGWVWPLYLVYFLAIAVVWGVYYLTAADAVADRSRPLRDRFRAAATRLPALVAVALLMWPLVSLGFALLVLPGVYLFHRLVLAYPACVVDRRGPLASLKASWSLAGGHVWKIFGVTLAYVVLTFGFGVVAGFFGGTYSLASSVVSAVFGSVLGPLYGLALGHLYLEGSRNT